MTARAAKRQRRRTPPRDLSTGNKIIRHPDYITVERTIEKLNDELLKRHAAHHLGVSKKYRKGRRLSETCITFYVRRKGKDIRAERVPKHIELHYENGARNRLVATDVCEIGKRGPVGFNVRGGYLVAVSGETGTVGMVFRQGGADLFLTNAHVATDPGKAPGPIGVRLPNGAIVPGSVIRLDNLSEPLIRSDAALVAMPANSVAHGQFHGVPLTLQNCGDIANNDPRRFFYVAAGFVHVVRWRAFMPAATPIKIDGHMLRYAGFHKFDVMLGQCRPGHSGAVVFCESAGGLTAVGLLFGGIQATNEVWVFPVRLSLAQMGINPDSF